MKKSLCILGFLVVLASSPAFAGPRDDSPRGGVDRLIQGIIGAAKRVLHLSPQDQIAVPRP
jgi:hypothetical protein